MRALAAATVAAAMSRASSAGSRVTPASSIPIPASLKNAASASYLERGFWPAAQQPAMRSGHDDRADVLGADREAESSAHTAGGSAISREAGFASAAAPFAQLGWLAQERAAASRHEHAGLAAERGGRRVRVSNDAARHHVGAVADARGHVADRGSRYAEFGKVVEPGNAGVGRARSRHR